VPAKDPAQAAKEEKIFPGLRGGKGRVQYAPNRADVIRVETATAVQAPTRA